MRFVVLPLLITAACFAFFLPADDALPWSRQERLILGARIDYAFVTYHFAAQHFGAPYVALSIARWTQHVPLDATPRSHIRVADRRSASFSSPISWRGRLGLCVRESRREFFPIS